MKGATDLDRCIGRRIRLHREKRGFTQQELAKPIGVTFQQIQKYENAVNRISASRLFAVAEVLNVPLMAFFHSTDHHGRERA
jgi:transcriptional regulator with XRE-family HTH domain